MTKVLGIRRVYDPLAGPVRVLTADALVSRTVTTLADLGKIRRAEPAFHPYDRLFIPTEDCKFSDATYSPVKLPNRSRRM
jgi:hypothetical protein